MLFSPWSRSFFVQANPLFFVTFWIKLSVLLQITRSESSLALKCWICHNIESNYRCKLNQLLDSPRGRGNRSGSSWTIKLRFLPPYSIFAHNHLNFRVG